MDRFQPTRGTGSPSMLVESDRQGFNRRWFAKGLQAVYVPASVADVTGCVQQALERYAPDVRIVSGRHCYEDFAYGADTKAIIDLSAINQVGFDEERQAFFVDAGAENWTVYRTLLNGFGKTLPAGSCYSVGAGGHITGGGYGLLSRLHGLTVDLLTGVEIVTWDARARQARLRYVSATSGDPAEAELFWALRGAGGGNFGVIVRYWFADLPDAPDHASLWSLAWDWADVSRSVFADIVGAYADMVADLPKGDFSLLKLTHRDAKQLGLTFQFTSPAGTAGVEHRRQVQARADDHRARFEAIVPTRAMGRPLGGHPGWLEVPMATQSVTHLTYLEALQTMSSSGPNRFGKYKSAYMSRGFSPAQIDALWASLTWTPPSGLDMSNSLVQVDSYGGAINDVEPAATAVPQRSSLLKLQFQTYWTNSSLPGEPSQQDLLQQQQYLTWIRDAYTSVYRSTGGTPDPDKDPTGSVQGCYYNYPDVDLGTNEAGDVMAALHLYFLGNRQRLLAVKRQWDPANVFRHAQSLPVT